MGLIIPSGVVELTSGMVGINKTPTQYALEVDGDIVVTDGVVSAPNLLSGAQGSFEISLRDATTSRATGTATYQVVGRHMIMKIPYMTGNVSTSANLSGFPTKIRPTALSVVPLIAGAADNTISAVTVFVTITNGVNVWIPGTGANFRVGNSDGSAAILCYEVDYNH